VPPNKSTHMGHITVLIFPTIKHTHTLLAHSEVHKGEIFSEKYIFSYYKEELG
jgi:hypothetical protein